MAYDKFQFKNLIQRILKEGYLGYPSAVNILLGTAAQESGFGTFLRQTGGGPALGAFQIEKATFIDIKRRFGQRFPEIKGFIFEQLEYDLRASIIMARLKYFSIPQALPDADDIKALAEYWKKYYNTPEGSGTVNEFLTNWMKYCD
jgi:hypothetical protein